MATQVKEPTYTAGTVKVLDASGHTTHDYNLETGVGVVEAQKALDEQRRRYGTTFDAKTKERVDSPKLGEHEELIVVPPMAGG